MDRTNHDYDIDETICPFRGGEKCNLDCALLIEPYKEDGTFRCSIHQIALSLDCMLSYGLNTYEQN